MGTAETWRSGWDVLFIHTDGAGDPAGQEASLISPAVTLIASSNAFDHHRQRCVPVVPVRETEAWMLAEPEALLRAWYISSPTPAQHQALRQIKRPEQITDPKSALEALYKTLKGKRDLSKTLDAIGREISREALLKLPSYKKMEAALRDALLQILG